jgi:hypothetical protein
MHTNKLKWMTKFEVIFLTEAREFLLLLDEKSRLMSCLKNLKVKYGI